MACLLLRLNNLASGRMLLELVASLCHQTVGIAGAAPHCFVVVLDCLLAAVGAAAAAALALLDLVPSQFDAELDRPCCDSCVECLLSAPVSWDLGLDLPGHLCKGRYPRKDLRDNLGRNGLSQNGYG